MQKSFNSVSLPLIEEQVLAAVRAFQTDVHAGCVQHENYERAAEGGAIRQSIKNCARFIFDFSCATVSLILLLPVFLIIAVAIRLEDGNGVIFSQERVGRNLRMFRLHKFRSMHVGAAQSSMLTSPGDGRVTRVGRFLRKYKLDELPQLINVMKGDMQLVGIRPQVSRYVKAFPREYRILLQDRPGIADLASLIFRNEEELFPKGTAREQEDHYLARILPHKLELSLTYRRDRTFSSDMRILRRTVFVLISSGARLLSEISIGDRCRCAKKSFEILRTKRSN